MQSLPIVKGSFSNVRFPPVADIRFDGQKASMRIMWAVVAFISLAAAAAVWLFAGGWAGGVPWLPDRQLLNTGEWPLWVAMFLLLYGPIASGGWCLFRAARADD